MNQAQHPKGYRDFTHVDDRCVGGKTLVMQHMKNHYDQLTEVKPQVKIEAPKKYVHETRKPVHKVKNKLIDPHHEVKVAFRKVANTTKGYVDDGKPISFNMKENLKGRYEKEKKFEQQEHLLNIKSMSKKLATKKKPMKDRLKDVNDPVAHPVRFFRRNKELPHKKVEYLTGLPGGSRLVITDNDAKLKEKFDKHLDQNLGNIQKSKLGPGSAHVGKSDFAGPSFNMASEEGVNSMPTAKDNRPGTQRVIADKQLVIDEKLSMPHLKEDPRAVSILEKRMLDVIVKYNYYRDVQLEALFSSIRSANATLKKEWLDEAIENVKRILDE